jgi:uncharacterized protein (TIGR02611 family)
MSAGAEDDDALRAAARVPLGLVSNSHQDTGTQQPPASSDTPAEPHRHLRRRHDDEHPDDDSHEGGHHHHHHQILIEPEEDRWPWRRKIRQNPRQLFFYRIAVGLAGLLLIAAGLVSGPLPGPGGIPLVLLGLAIWSSEFEWAYRLMQWFKLQLHKFRQWTRPQQVAFWVVFFGCCGLLGYTYMLVLGIPGWLPNFADQLLARLPGI